jgi:CRP-like cAMP-binding protein
MVVRPEQSEPGAGASLHALAEAGTGVGSAATLSAALETLARATARATAAEVVVARVVDELDAPAGKVLATEGEVGREFFVLLEGETAVTQGGQEIAVLGPGDFFGEIALLEDMPRTATVTAKTRLRFFVLTRQAFRGVAERYPDVDAKVRAAAAERLG